jgi:ribosomal protein L16 Arg81 hydroxylase
MIGGIDALSYCLRSLSADDFFSHYWENAAFISEREIPDRFSDLLTVAAFDALIASSTLLYPTVMVVNDGQSPFFSENPSEYSHDLLYDGFRNGSTLALHVLQEYWDPLRRLSQSLAKQTGASVTASAYLTPPRSRGLLPHYDSHDVIILQLSGTKRWRLWENVLSPLPCKCASTQLNPEVISQTSGIDPIVEVDLATGQTLYIPRGVIHEATTADGHSLHVTLGLRYKTYGDLAIDTLKAEMTVLCTPAYGPTMLPDSRLTVAEFTKALISQLSDRLQSFTKD